MFLNKQYIYLRQINPQQIQFLLHSLPSKEKVRGHCWTRVLTVHLPLFRPVPRRVVGDWSLYRALPLSNQMPRGTVIVCRLRGLKQKPRLYPESSKKYKPRRSWLSVGKVCLNEARTTYLLRLSIVCTWESKGKDR